MDRNSQLEENARRTNTFSDYCGIRFESASDDKCVVSCALRRELLNPDGIAHGGLVTTMADVCAGLMAHQADNWTHALVTQSCSIHYLRPAAGETIRAESRVIRKGRRVCTVQVDCFSGDGKLSATAIYEIAYLGEIERA